MRSTCWLAGAVLAVALAAPAHGQVLSFGGPVPQPRFIIPFPGVQNTLFSLQDPNVPIAQPQNIGQRSGFNLSRFLPNLGTRNAAPVIGQTIYPTPNQQPGIDFFRPFRLRRPGPLIPQ